MNEPSVSVIIATYNRAAMLDDCLLWLRQQSWRPGDEIIVADNGSTDDTMAVVARHHDAAPLIRYILETTPGKSAALQTALSHAGGEVIVLTDDDVRVGPQWITTLRREMADASVVLAGGPVTPRWERQAPRWLRIGHGPFTRLAAPIALLDYGTVAADLDDRTLLGANMAIRREALTELGGFSPHLGKLRDTLLSGEDAELCERVRQRGWCARYVPGARVQHWVPATRMRIGYYLRWFYWSGITHAALDDGQDTGGRRLVGLPAWLLRHAVRAVGRAIPALVQRRPDVLVDCANDLAFAAGYAVRHRRLTSAATANSSSARRQPA